VLATPDKKDVLANIPGMENIDLECCWSFYSNKAETIICPKTHIRCQREKKIVLFHVYSRCLLADREGWKIINVVKETYDYGVERE